MTEKDSTALYYICDSVKSAPHRALELIEEAVNTLDNKNFSPELKNLLKTWLKSLKGV